MTFNCLYKSLVVSALLASSVGAIAQTKGSKTTKSKLPQAIVNARFRRGHAKTPIQFRPFSMVDESGKPIPPDQRVTLPNGKTTTAKEYFDSLNRIEKSLNSIGYTMRSGNTKETISSPLISPAMLQTQAKSYPKNILKGVDNEGAPPGPIFEMAQNAKIAKHKGGMEHGPTALKNISRNGQMINPFGISTALKIASKPASSPGGKGSSGKKGQTSFDPNKGDLVVMAGMSPTVKFNKPWSFAIGDSDFGAYFNGSLDVEGSATTKNNSGYFSDSQSVFNVSMSGKAGVNLISNTIDLVNYKAEFDGSDVTKKVHFNGSLFVAGVQVYSEDLTKDVGYTFEDGWSIPYSYDTPEFEFPVFGPFVIKGKAGAQGDAGVKLDLILYSSHIQGEVHPYVHSKATAQIAGGVDLEIASGEAGVRCDLNLLNDDLRIGTNVGIAFDTTAKKLNLQEEFYCTNQIDALSGTVSLYATVYGLFGVKLKEWDWDWYSWTGFQDNSTFFNKKYDQPLLWQ